MKKAITFSGRNRFKQYKKSQISFLFEIAPCLLFSEFEIENHPFVSKGCVTSLEQDDNCNPIFVDVEEFPGRNING